jgi:hypothetical protein
VQDYFIFIHGFNIHDGEDLDDVVVDADAGNFNVDRANGFYFDSFSKAGNPPPPHRRLENPVILSPRNVLQIPMSRPFSKQHVTAQPAGC